MNKLFVDCLAEDAESIIDLLLKQKFAKSAEDTVSDYSIGRINYSQLVIKTTKSAEELEKYLLEKNFKSIDAVIA